MLGPIWRWRCHRAAVDRAGWLRPFSGRAGFKRVLFLSERDTICHAQIFPFFVHSHDFVAQLRIEIRELPLSRFLEGRHPYNAAVNAVCFQTWFDLTPKGLTELVDRIERTWPDARFAYFDWFAPADLRYAEVLGPRIAAYVKKQTFREFASYGSITLGDTNLTDFYAKRFHINLPETRYLVSTEFQQKLVLGSGFEYSPGIVQILSRPLRFANRTIDVHARIAIQGTEWYMQMRKEAQAKAARLAVRFQVAHRGRVSRRQYLNELRVSKLCFSPFGYGEVCWRDFEAMSTGALLLKPDMSHLRLANDFFEPFETYVPLSWDLKDLEEKVDYYINHPSETESIARTAFERLSRYHRQRKFLVDIARLWQLLRISEHGSTHSLNEPAGNAAPKFE